MPDSPRPKTPPTGEAGSSSSMGGKASVVVTRSMNKGRGGEGTSKKDSGRRTGSARFIELTELDGLKMKRQKRQPWGDHNY
jgi:hypothetical protein